jgi:hypothetical protein
MYGVEAPISKLQTATGVKDKVAQYWIDILLEKARQMKADNPGHSPASIADDLQKWLDEQPGDKVNPLLDIAGTLSSDLYRILFNYLLRSRPQS